MRCSGDSPIFPSACFLHSVGGSGAGNWRNVRPARWANFGPDSYYRSSEQFLEENLLCERYVNGNVRRVRWIPCQSPSRIAIALSEIVVTVTVELHFLDDLVGILNKTEDVVDLVHFVLADDACCDLLQHLLAGFIRFHKNFHRLDIIIL